MIAANGDLAVALRERVPRGLAVVRDVRPEEMSEGLSACRPWPWMVVGAVDQVSGPVRTTLHSRPVLAFWQGAVPEGLPAHLRGFASFRALADAVTSALHAGIGGLRLAPGCGVELPDGRMSQSLELQALVSAHPHHFQLPRSLFGSCQAPLRRSGAPVRAGTVGKGGVGLLPQGEIRHGSE